MSNVDKLDKGSPVMAGHAPLDRGPRREEGLEAATAPEGGQGLSGENDVLELQQTAGNSAVSSLLAPAAPTPGDAIRSVISAPGSALDSSTASMIGSAVGHDVSRARIHTGPEVKAATEGIGAKLAASGDHILAPDGLDTHTETGLFETFHEFVHFGQQQQGDVDGTVTSDGLKISDPSDRFEQQADTVAAQAVAQRTDGESLSGSAGQG